METPLEQLLLLLLLLLSLLLLLFLLLPGLVAVIMKCENFCVESTDA